MLNKTIWLSVNLGDTPENRKWCVDQMERIARYGGKCAIIHPKYNTAKIVLVKYVEDAPPCLK